MEAELLCQKLPTIVIFLTEEGLEVLAFIALRPPSSFFFFLRGEKDKDLGGYKKHKPIQMNLKEGMGQSVAFQEPKGKKEKVYSWSS